MKLLTLLGKLPLLQAGFHGALVPVAPVGAGAAVALDGEDDDGAARGCGWFDSSHELRHGLQVTEHASADAVANDLPVHTWLLLHLACRTVHDRHPCTT